MRKRNVVKQRKYHKKWLASLSKEEQEKLKEYQRQNWRKYFKHAGKVSHEEFQERLKSQGNLCPICNTDMKDPCQDHDHSSGKIRDILCRRCNRVLGQVHEDAAILANCINYLERHRQ